MLRLRLWPLWGPPIDLARPGWHRWKQHWPARGHWGPRLHCLKIVTVSAVNPTATGRAGHPNRPATSLPLSARRPPSPGRPSSSRPSRSRPRPRLPPRSRVPSTLPPGSRPPWMLLPPALPSMMLAPCVRDHSRACGCGCVRRCGGLFVGRRRACPRALRFLC